MKDYYAILGVDRGASQEDIQKAFRKLAHQHHPDKQGGDAGRFKEINEAYQVLGNEQRRSQYDHGGFAGGAGQGEAGFDFSNFSVNFGDGSFDDFVDAVRTAFTGQSFHGDHVAIDLMISFDESILGTEKEVTIPYRKKSPETVRIAASPGVYDGAELVIRGKGEPAPDGRHQPGDLRVRFRVQEHPHLRRVNRDIVCTLDLTVSEALLGIEKEAPWISGKTFSVTIPERTRHGDTYVATNVALPESNLLDRVVVLCNVVQPKKMSKKVQSLLEDLRDEGW
ncbi:MAG: DnaJ domain-containing protein [Candidatus Kaiserbacteria bacterium]|nr:DnaJ domain-containing protein [Candidatus Kaiserbacteria bacterium]